MLSAATAATLLLDHITRDIASAIQTIERYHNLFITVSSRPVAGKEMAMVCTQSQMNRISPARR
jgi:hypothetical protein